MSDKSKNPKTPKVVLTDATASGSKNNKADETISEKDGNIDMEQMDTENILARQRASSIASITSVQSGNSNKSANKRLREEFDNERENELELGCMERHAQFKKMLLETLETRRVKGTRVTADVIEQISEDYDELTRVVTKMAIENASLRGQLKNRRVEPISFSSVVRQQRAEQRIPPVTGATRKAIEKRHTVIIKQVGRKPEQPIDRKTVITMLNPVQEKLKIKTCRSTRKGDVVIEAATELDLKKITENRKLLDGGFTLEKPSKRKPRVIIFDVPTEYSEEELLEAVISQNEERMMDMEKEQLKEHLQLKFKTGKKDRDTTNWVFEVPAEVRNILRKLNYLYIDIRRCKVSDFTAVSRCYKCQGLGHITKYCSADKDTCGHCAQEGHTFKVCPNKAQKQKCVPCKRAGKPHQHATDKSCPEYKAALEQQRLKTDYG